MLLLHILGFLGADPETRFTPGGQKVTTLRVASKSRKGGQEETIWWRITVWGDQFDKMLPHFKKGYGIYVVAEMQKLEIYQDKNGQPQISYEATARSLHFPPFKDSRGDEQQQQGSSSSSSSGYKNPSHGQNTNPYSSQRDEGKADAFEALEEDTIPF